MQYKAAKAVTAVISEGLMNADGVIPYTLMNDYMFRIILQKHKKVLTCLICAVLRIDKEDVTDIIILNPIKLGEAIDDKTFILDVNVLLNSNTVINLEMQVLNNGDWPERSLSYLAKNYDNVAKGGAYIDVKPVYHIGFLDYTLFPDYPEFFAKYMMLNVKNHNIYTTKFNLYVIDLTKIDIADEEDKAGDLIHWVQLFKATTWKELRQMAEDNQDCREAAEALYEYNQDETVRQQCRAREDYYIREKVIARKMEEKDIALEEKDAMLKEQRLELGEKDAALEKKNVELEEKDTVINQKNAQLINSVKSLIENLHISEDKACTMIGMSIEEYEKLQK